MPPSPPESFFDARFKSGNYVQSIFPDNGPTLLPILIRSAVFPITLSWETKSENDVTYRLTRGQEAGMILAGMGQIVIQNLPSDQVDLKAVAREIPKLPHEYSLSQNYPNPFNPSTKFDYQLIQPGRVSLIVYDVLGEEIQRIVDGALEAGFYSSIWDATNSPSGLYYARMIVNDGGGKEVYRETKKVLLMK